MILKRFRSIRSIVPQELVYKTYPFYFPPRRPSRSFSAIRAKCTLLYHLLFLISHLAQRREAPYCKVEIAK